MFKQIVKTLFIFPIRIYQFVISPFFPPSCRHIPSCSEYTVEAIRTHGVFKGLKLGSKRILSCHPRGAHGYDAVPQKESQHVA